MSKEYILKANIPYEITCPDCNHKFVRKFIYNYSEPLKWETPKKICPECKRNLYVKMNNKMYTYYNLIGCVNLRVSPTNLTTQNTLFTCHWLLVTFLKNNIRANQYSSLTVPPLVSALTPCSPLPFSGMNRVSLSGIMWMVIFCR